MSDPKELRKKQKLVKELYRFVEEQVLAGLFKTDIVDKLIELGVDKITAGELVDEMEERIRRRQKKTVLLIMPRGEQVDALMKRMKIAGLQPTPVETSEKILVLVEQTVPDLLLMAHQPPDIDGQVVLKQLRQHPMGRSLPVFVLGERNSMRDAFAAYRLVEFVDVPWEVDDLLARMTRILSVPKKYEWENWLEDRDQD